MIDLANRRVHEIAELERLVVYHEKCIPSSEVCFKSGFSLCSFDVTVTATQDVLGDDGSNLSPCGIVLSVPTTADDD